MSIHDTKSPPPTGWHHKTQTVKMINASQGSFDRALASGDLDPYGREFTDRHNLTRTYYSEADHNAISRIVDNHRLKRNDVVAEAVEEWGHFRLFHGRVGAVYVLAGKFKIAPATLFDALAKADLNHNQDERALVAV